MRRSRRFDSWSASQSPFRQLEYEFGGQHLGFHYPNFGVKIRTVEMTDLDEFVGQHPGFHYPNFRVEIRTVEIAVAVAVGVGVEIGVQE